MKPSHLLKRVITLAEPRFRAGEPNTSIAYDLGVSVATVHRARRLCGVPQVKQGRPRKEALL